MQGVRKQTIQGVNEQLQELRKHSDIDSTVTFVTFAGPQDVKTKYVAKPISEVKDLVEDDYQPNGATAMYDGVGRVLNEIQQNVVDDDGTTYLILVVSDGEENQSQEYTSQQIADMITERKNTKKWSINYIGANQDLTIVAKSLNIGPQSTLTWSATSAGASQMWNNVSGCTASYMSTRSISANDSSIYATLSSSYLSNNKTDTTTDIVLPDIK